MNKLIALLTATLLPSLSYAMFCPNNLNSIDMGNSIAEVQQQCGMPNSQKTYKATPAEQDQRWQYYKTAHNGSNSSINLTIAFVKSKAINISVNGVSLQVTDICSNTIKIDDSLDSIKAACGTPNYIDKSTNNAKQAPPADMTEYTYNGMPPVTLIFENGKLTARH